MCASGEAMYEGRGGALDVIVPAEERRAGPVAVETPGKRRGRARGRAGAAGV